MIEHINLSAISAMLDCALSGECHTSPRHKKRVEFLVKELNTFKLYCRDHYATTVHFRRRNLPGGVLCGENIPVENTGILLSSPIIRATYASYVRELRRKANFGYPDIFGGYSSDAELLEVALRLERGDDWRRRVL